jgi:hypothetical protein
MSCVWRRHLVGHAPGAMLPKRVGKVGPAARERSIEECLTIRVPRVEVRIMRHQELNHRLQARQLRMEVKHQRVASIVVRVRQRRVFLQQRRDALDAVAPDGIEYGSSIPSGHTVVFHAFFMHERTSAHAYDEHRSSAFSRVWYTCRSTTRIDGLPRNRPRRHTRAGPHLPREWKTSGRKIWCPRARTALRPLSRSARQTVGTVTGCRARLRAEEMHRRHPM